MLLLSRAKTSSVSSCCVFGVESSEGFDDFVAVVLAGVGMSDPERGVLGNPTTVVCFMLNDARWHLQEEDGRPAGSCWWRRKTQNKAEAAPVDGCWGPNVEMRDTA